MSVVVVTCLLKKPCVCENVKNSLELSKLNLDISDMLNEI